tara:strand:- start:2076 stop:3059 length:984 start_codon:yes stop_codon:yes gene_type:complete
MTIYFIITFLIIFFFTKASYKLKLVDLPNERKSHSRPVAYTGGLAICLTYILSIYLFNIPFNELNLIISIGSLIAAVGFLDDKQNLNIGGKLSLQIIPMIYLIVFENLSLNQIGDYNFFKLELNSFSIPFTIFCLIFLVNAFNYFDGLDGVLSSTSISVLAILYFLTTNEHIKTYLIIIFLPLCVFLLFNFSFFNLPKLFLGDSGSLLLGFIIGFILIYFANQRIAHPIILAWSIAIFVYEFISINLIRFKNKKNIFKPGQDHLHHVLFKKNKSLLLTNFLIVFSNLSLFTIGYVSFEFFNPFISLVLFICCFVIFFIFRSDILIKR